MYRVSRLCMCGEMSHSTQNCIIPSCRMSPMNYSCPDRYIIDGDGLPAPDRARSFKTIAPSMDAGGRGRMLWSLLEPKGPVWCWFFHHVLTCRYPLTMMMNRDIFDDPLSLFFFYSALFSTGNTLNLYFFGSLVYDQTNDIPAKMLIQRW